MSTVPPKFSTNMGFAELAPTFILDIGASGRSPSMHLTTTTDERGKKTNAPGLHDFEDYL